MKIKLFLSVTTAICGIMLNASAQVDLFAAAINKHGRNPVDYVADKFKDHYIVSLGEDHWIKDHSLFLCELLRDLDARQDSTGVDVLAFEFGNSADQNLANEIAVSPTYREDLAIKILQRSPDTYGNPYLEFLEVFKTVWDINQGRPEGKKMRILLLDPPFMLDYMNGDSSGATYSRDVSMMTLIQSYILSKKRILFYAGLGHTRKAINGVYMGEANNIYYNYHSAGYLLASLYPDLVFSIKLWGGLMGGNGYTPVAGPERWERVYNGDIDRAFAANGNKPVAFDVADIPPFKEVTVAEFYKMSSATLERGNDKMVGSPYNGGELLSDDIDGIIFLKPVEQYSGATVVGRFFDDEFLKVVEKRTDGKVKTRHDVYEYIKNGHPIMSDSLDKLIENE